MKKFLYIFITTSMLFLSNVKSANANIVFDLTEIVSEVSEIVGKITDAAGKVTNTVNMVKQTATQGFSKEQLMSLAQKYVGNLAGGLIDGLKQKWGNRKAEELQEAADKKNLAVLDNDIESYKESSEEELDTKKKEAEKQKMAVIKQHGATQARINVLTPIVDELRKNCETAVIMRNTICEKYRKKRAELETEELLLADLDEKRTQLDGIVKDLGQKLTEIETQPEYIKLEKRKEDIEQRIEEKKSEIVEKQEAKQELINKIKGEAEWDSSDEDLKDFKVKEEDYKSFLKDYFYNPDAIGDSDDNKFVAHQGARDNVERNRKQLIVNSAAHLMQVTAVLRAETTQRRRIVEEYIRTTVEGEGETQSISSYSATKVEYIRALILYAKMQTAKLQYLSAKALIKSDVMKSYNLDDAKNYLDKDMSIYQLDQNDISKIYEDMKIEDVEWR